MEFYTLIFIPFFIIFMEIFHNIQIKIALQLLNEAFKINTAIFLYFLLL